MPVVSYPCKLVGWPGGMDGAPVLAVINTGDISISVTEKMLISTSLADIQFTQVDGTVALKNLVTQTYIGVLVFQRKVVTRSSAVLTNTAGGIPLDPECRWIIESLMELLISACHVISNGAKCATRCATSAVNYISSFVGGSCTRVSDSRTPEKSILSVLFLSDGQSFKLITRFAGFSGFVATVLSAYGSNVLSEEAEVDQLRKRALQNANKHHFIHTFGLLHCSKASYPYLTALLFSSGMVIYCGSCYKFAVWSRKYTPIGGHLFMLGWCSFILREAHMSGHQSRRVNLLYIHNFFSIVLSGVFIVPVVNKDFVFCKELCGRKYRSLQIGRNLECHCCA